MVSLLLGQFWNSSGWPGLWIPSSLTWWTKEMQDNGKPAFSLIFSFPPLPHQPACMSLYICSWLLHGTWSTATKQTTGPVTEKAEGSVEWEAPNLFSRRGMIGQDELQSYVHYLLACHLAVSPFWAVSRGGSSDQAGAEKHRQDEGTLARRQRGMPLPRVGRRTRSRQAARGHPECS
ncbi:uncharacterized protein LOC129022364 isoform X2 [Pongo pygmaeus]|uniref:uncharacterized protein LOC129022364 isoform X2 n=1 Tax=Pongo pygmaeus TaxID=9600 RepID=UPI0023E34558|nr:uncharacterized protein LOC129022364 isoform X2 [Pongo pygmaeus]XP_054324446.1 uncharacterized protein LOC129022364 isoform X2 [Pongo pygmaeus]